MARVHIYTIPGCPYCSKAKRLLGLRGIPYEEQNVAGNERMRVWLRQTTGRQTVPQIFIDREPIGGAAELEALDVSGALRGLGRGR